MIIVIVLLLLVIACAVAPDFMRAVWQMICGLAMIAIAVGIIGGIIAAIVVNT